MSFPFKGKVTRASNGTVEITPDNQFDLEKVRVGKVVTLHDTESLDAENAKGKKTAKK